MSSETAIKAPLLARSAPKAPPLPRHPSSALPSAPALLPHPISLSPTPLTRHPHLLPSPTTPSTSETQSVAIPGCHRTTSPPLPLLFQETPPSTSRIVQARLRADTLALQHAPRRSSSALVVFSVVDRVSPLHFQSTHSSKIVRWRSRHRWASIRSLLI